MAIFLSRSNDNFINRTKSNQKTGLDVCLDMISKETGIKNVHIDNHNHALDAIKRSGARVVIFEALNFSHHFINQLRSNVSFRPFVHVHSKFPFLGVEPTAYKFIKDYIDNDIGVIFNSTELRDCFPKSKNNLFLENIYSGDPLEPKIFSDKEFINVGCHGSMRHMKNIPLQAIAAKIYAESKGLKLRFHINNTRHDGDGTIVLNSLKSIFSGSTHEIVECPYVGHESFKLYINKNIDIGMQVSLSETFNIIAADYIYSGVPVVVSDEIYWCDDLSKAKYSSVESIIEKMDLSLNNPVLLKRNQDNIYKHLFFAKQQWINFLGDYDV